MQASVPELMDISKEPKETLDLYGATPGDGSFASNCLTARRLAERGVRFIQLYHRDWDHHGDLVKYMNICCGATDRATWALLTDLKRRDMLNDTLVIWGGEFGRTPMFQGKGGPGRDHHIKGFSMWLAGGGVKGGRRLRRDRRARLQRGRERRPRPRPARDDAAPARASTTTKFSGEVPGARHAADRRRAVAGRQRGPRVTIVRSGLDVLRDSEWKTLRGRRVGLVCHPASVDSHLRHAVDLFAAAPGFDLVALFGPEHGFHGVAQDLIGVGDSSAGTLRVHSLYGSTVESLRPTAEQLRGIDTLVVDLQDIGSRYYTFQATMLYCLEAAAAHRAASRRARPAESARRQGGRRPGASNGLREFRGPTRHRDPAWSDDGRTRPTLSCRAGIDGRSRGHRRARAGVVG